MTDYDYDKLYYKQLMKKYKDTETNIKRNTTKTMIKVSQPLKLYEVIYNQDKGYNVAYVVAVDEGDAARGLILETDIKLTDNKMDVTEIPFDKRKVLGYDKTHLNARRKKKTK